jgi:hypothetical protein
MNRREFISGVGSVAVAGIVVTTSAPATSNGTIFSPVTSETSFEEMKIVVEKVVVRAKARMLSAEWVCEYNQVMDMEYNEEALYEIGDLLIANTH